MPMKYMSTGEFWTEEQQRGYAAMIARQYRKHEMTLHQLEDELAGGFISQEDFERIQREGANEHE